MFVAILLSFWRLHRCSWCFSLVLLFVVWLCFIRYFLSLCRSGTLGPLRGHLLCLAFLLLHHLSWLCNGFSLPRLLLCCIALLSGLRLLQLPLLFFLLLFFLPLLPQLLTLILSWCCRLRLLLLGLGLTLVSLFGLSSLSRWGSILLWLFNFVFEVFGSLGDHEVVSASWVDACGWILNSKLSCRLIMLHFTLHIAVDMVWQRW